MSGWKDCQSTAQTGSVRAIHPGHLIQKRPNRNDILPAPETTRFPSSVLFCGNWRRNQQFPSNQHA